MNNSESITVSIKVQYPDQYKTDNESNFTFKFNPNDSVTKAISKLKNLKTIQHRHYSLYRTLHFSNRETYAEYSTINDNLEKIFYTSKTKIQEIADKTLVIKFPKN